MSDEESGIDLPEGWQATTYDLTGNFKLIATFEHEATGAEIRVTPYRTYEQPGFANAHRVIFVHPEEGVEEAAVGMDVEHAEEAETAAKAVMKERNNT